MSKLEFKEFVRNNPKLLKYIKDKTMNRQQFYEIYDMYGENNEIWDQYLKETIPDITNNKLGDFMNYFKNINLDNVQESINSIQRVLGVISEISLNDKTPSNKYEPKPLYKHFDD